MRRNGLAFVTVGLAALASAARAEPTVQLTQLSEYSSGLYGETQRTDVVLLATTLRVSSGANAIRVTAPFLHVTGPRGVAVTEDGVEGTASGSGRGSEAGLGDVAVSATRSFNRLRRTRAYLDVTGRVRLPTGSRSRGLGVGAVDYGLATELGYDGRRGGAFVSGGRRFLGRVSGSRREDGWQAGAGFWLTPRAKTVLGASYGWREASRPGDPDPADISAFASRQVGPRLRLAINGAVGLSEGSPDYAVGLAVGWRLRPAQRR